MKRKGSARIVNRRTSRSATSKIVHRFNVEYTNYKSGKVRTEKYKVRRKDGKVHGWNPLTKKVGWF